MDPFLANHHADRLIVGFKDGHTTFANLAGLNTSVTLERTLGKARTPGSGKLALEGMNISLVKTNGSESLKSVAEKLSRDPAVAYVEPDYIVNRTANANDPLLFPTMGTSKDQSCRGLENDQRFTHSIRRNY